MTTCVPRHPTPDAAPLRRCVPPPPGPKRSECGAQLQTQYGVLLHTSKSIARMSLNCVGRRHLALLNSCRMLHFRMLHFPAADAAAPASFS